MKIRIKTRRTFQRQYEDLAAAAKEKGGTSDRAYNRILVSQDRLLKVLTGHSHTIDSLERKLESIWYMRSKEPVNQKLKDNHLLLREEQQMMYATDAFPMQMARDEDFTQVFEK